MSSKSDEYSLTSSQKKILEFVKSYIVANNLSPTVREICDATGIKSTSTAHAHLKTMTDEGYLSYTPGTRRAITVTDNSTKSVHSDTLSIPVVGDVAAGLPILAVDNIQEYYSLPSVFINGASKDSIFMLCIKGNSMVEIGMYENDLIVVNSDASVDNGDIAVARIGGDTVTVKRFYLEGDRVRLQPENSTMQPIFAQLNDVEIVGKVIGLIRHF